MKKCLILLTNYYPYYKGEEYLETEIPYLSNQFEKVLVIPTMVNEKMTITRQTPSNVDVLTINYYHTQKNKIVNTLKKTKLKNKSTNKNIICMLYQNYFNNRSLTIYDLIIKKIADYDFSDYSGIVIYSYWLYITAQTGVLLKEYLSENLNVPIKCVSRAHRYDLYENETKYNFLPSRDYLLKNLDLVYPCSDDGTSYLKGKYPEYSHKIVTQRLGTKYIGTNEIKPTSRFHIVSCSALRKVKRVDLIVEALHKLEQNNIDFFWTHFGDGPEESRIKDIARQKLKSSNYEFYGFITNSELMDYYSNHPINCFINVSESEGIPVSIMEALSFSIPVIATDVGGTKEIVKNNVNGYLIDKDVHSDELATKIKFMIDNTENYTGLRLKSYEIWHEKINSDKNYIEFSNYISFDLLKEE